MLLVYVSSNDDSLFLFAFDCAGKLQCPPSYCALLGKQLHVLCVAMLHVLVGYYWYGYQDWVTTRLHATVCSEKTDPRIAECR